jgi:CysZ protein
MGIIWGLRRFVAGGLLLVQSALLLLQYRQLLLLAVAPLGLTLVLYTAVLALGVHYYAEWFALLLAHPQVWYLQIGYEVVHLLVFLLVLALLWFSFTFIGTALAAPFLDRLSHHVETLLEGARNDFPQRLPVQLGNWGRALWHALLLSLLWGALLLLTLLPGVGHLCWVLGTWLLLAYNFSAFTLDRRGWAFRTQWRVLRSEGMATLGLGAALFLLLALPGVGLLLLPIATVAGTLLVRDIERRHPRPTDYGRAALERPL